MSWFKRKRKDRNGKNEEPSVISSITENQIITRRRINRKQSKQEQPHRWHPINILDSLYEEIYKLIEMGKFVSVPAFVDYCIRKELDRKRK